MLTKTDLDNVKEVVEDTMVEIVRDTIIPAFETVALKSDTDDLRGDINKLQNQVDRIDNKLDRIAANQLEDRSTLNKHDSRITNLEKHQTANQ